MPDLSAVTATDIRGTAVIVLGVILIMVFSSINHGLQQSISMERYVPLGSSPFGQDLANLLGSTDYGDEAHGCPISS